MDQNQVYALYRQLHPVTTIEHCVCCNFVEQHQKSVVVAGTNLIQVFRLSSDSEAGLRETGAGARSQDQLPDKSQDGRLRRIRLEFVCSFQLHGNILSMQSIRLAGATLDSLLVSFSEAKLSVVEFDPSTQDLKTTSLHHFEDDELKDGHCQNSANAVSVRVDPDERCAAMIIYGRRLVVLPFRRDLPVDTADGLTSGDTQLPVLSSYTIDLHKLDEKINSVIDFQFLHGYYEPTLLILYEPLPTWSGRIAMRKDTCSIVALSLNLQQRVNPVIWSVANLPMDCCQVCPVPKPVGGVLVFAVNSLLYLNQSQPPYGVSLNSFTTLSTEFLLKVQDGVKITLDCAHGTFVSSDKLVLSLRGGELYVLTLLVDGMRVVRGFNLDKAAASVLTSCMCVCGDGLLFLGSRLGNSLLLRYTEKMPEDLCAESVSGLGLDGDQPPVNKKRKLADCDWLDLQSIEDLDELEVYGTSTTRSDYQLTQYTFEVCDSLLNIGPCAHMVMGEPAFLSEEFHSVEEHDLELVTTSGYGKNGALTVLQRTIRPQVVTTFELPGCTNMWTVIGYDSADSEQDSGEQTHMFLIMSREDSSMVLKTGQEIMELDQSGLNTREPTVFASNIGSNRYVMQVCARGVRLLDGVKQLQQIPLDVGAAITSCSVADPYVVLLADDGQMILLTLKPDAHGTGARLVVTKPSVQLIPRITTLCAFSDDSRTFILTHAVESTAPVSQQTTVPESSAVSVEDEEELLYGDSSGSKTASSQSANGVDGASSAEPELKLTYWLAVCRENGALEIYSLPDCRLCFSVKNFPNGEHVLIDSMEYFGDENFGNFFGADELKSEKLLETSSPSVVEELLLICLGSRRRMQPFIMARVNDDLLIYESFSHHTPQTSGSRLQLRFKKVNHGLLLGQRKPAPIQAKSDASLTVTERRSSIPWLRPFDDISGYCGVFICGPSPYWMMMTSRGMLRIHPMSIDGPITCFTPFHNVNCPKGFLYFNQQGELRICVLPTHLSYDAAWPVRKVPLRCTPHFIAYHTDSKTYGLATSVSEQCSKLVKVVGDGEKEFEALEREERFVHPTLDRFSVQLFSPVTWEPIPNTKFELDEFERASCMHSVSLKSEGTVSGRKPYIALGTNYAFGEDVTCRGRVVIFDVVEVVPEPGLPLTKNKLKVECDKEQRGAITALDSVQGFLATAIGQKVYIWQLKDDDLCGIAFIDVQIYVQSLATIKNLILVGDIFKSISLLRYQEDMKVLSLVSRDCRPLEVFTVAYMVDNTNLNFVVSDKEKNVFLYSYMPQERDSHGGQLLLRRSAIHVGSHINSMFRVQCKATESDVRRSVRRHATYFASLDGSVGYLLPVSEKMYRRLSMLQNLLTTYMPHKAGLNPKAYRMARYAGRQLSRPIKNIVDADLLWKFLELTASERAEIARRLVTSVNQIVADLIDIDKSTAHF